jgi:uncharacterized short protein YbdD (DUF466 family)
MSDWRRRFRLLVQGARLMVGVPDYDGYVAQRRHFNPEAPVMSRAEYVRRCGERRFGGRSPRGCC